MSRGAGRGAGAARSRTSAASPAAAAAPLTAAALGVGDGNNKPYAEWQPTRHRDLLVGFINALIDFLQSKGIDVNGGKRFVCSDKHAEEGQKYARGKKQSMLEQVFGPGFCRGMPWYKADAYYAITLLLNEVAQVAGSDHRMSVEEARGPLDAQGFITHRWGADAGVIVRVTRDGIEGVGPWKINEAVVERVVVGGDYAAFAAVFEPLTRGEHLAVLPEQPDAAYVRGKYQSTAPGQRYERKRKRKGDANREEAGAAAAALAEPAWPPVDDDGYATDGWEPSLDSPHCAAVPPPTPRFDPSAMTPSQLDGFELDFELNEPPTKAAKGALGAPVYTEQDLQTARVQGFKEAEAVYEVQLKEAHAALSSLQEQLANTQHELRVARDELHFRQQPIGGERAGDAPPSFVDVVDLTDDNPHLELSCSQMSDLENFQVPGSLSQEIAAA